MALPSPPDTTKAPEPTGEPQPAVVEPIAIGMDNVHRLTLQSSFSTEDEKAISSLALSKDGRFIAYTYWHDPEKVIRLFDLTTETTLPPLLFHKRDVTSVAFSPDGDLLAAGSQDGSVSLWRVGDWELAETFFTLKDGISSLAFSPNGAFLALGGYKNHLALWSFEDAALQPLFFGTGPHVTDRVMFTQDGSVIYADTSYADVTAWSVATGEQVQSIRGEACIGSFDLSSADTRLAYSSSCSAAQEPHDPLAVIAVRDVSSGEALMYGSMAETSTVLYFTEDDALILTNSDGTVRFWDALDGSLHYLLPKTARYVEFILSEDGSTLILGEADGDILIYGLEP